MPERSTITNICWLCTFFVHCSSNVRTYITYAFMHVYRTCMHVFMQFLAKPTHTYAYISIYSYTHKYKFPWTYMCKHVQYTFTIHKCWRATSQMHVLQSSPSSHLRSRHVARLKSDCRHKASEPLRMRSSCQPLRVPSSIHARRNRRPGLVAATASTGRNSYDGARAWAGPIHRVGPCDVVRDAILVPIASITARSIAYVHLINISQQISMSCVPTRGEFKHWWTRACMHK